MRIVSPDFDRRIDLHGVGACPRPVDIDRAQHDFATLVSLRVYAFAAGMTIDGEAEEDEVYVVLMRGAAEVAVTCDGAEAGRWTLGVAGGPRAVYLPPLSSYRLIAREDSDVAYARAVPAGSVPAPAAFAPTAGWLASDHATRMAMTLTGDGEIAPAASERFVHLRGAGAATLGGVTLGDWDSALLDDGEDAVLVVTHGEVEVLTVGAKGR